MIQLNPSNLAISGFRFSHHSDSSGYLPLAQHLPGTVIDSSKLINLIDHPLAARVAFGVFDLYLLAIQSRFQLIHHLYPELHLFWSSHRQTQVKIVATIHLPVEIIVDYKKGGKADPIREFIYFQRYQCFSNVSGIITLTKKQNSELEHFFPNTKVRFIPHGVNRKEQYVRFYDKQPDQVDIISVGWNFRDFEMYRGIVDYCLQEKPHWRFHLVGTLLEWKNYFKSYRNVIIHPYLVDQEYFSLINSCQVSLMPLTFATANNAILEAHTLGIPTVVSDLPAVRDYAVRHMTYFQNRAEAIACIAQIEAMSASYFNQVRQEILTDAQQFYWESIAAEVMDFYQEILAQP